ELRVQQPQSKLVGRLARRRGGARNGEDRLALQETWMVLKRGRRQRPRTGRPPRPEQFPFGAQQRTRLLGQLLGEVARVVGRRRQNGGAARGGRRIGRTRGRCRGR